MLARSPLINLCTHPDELKARVFANLEGQGKLISRTGEVDKPDRISKRSESRSLNGSFSAIL